MVLSGSGAANGIEIVRAAHDSSVGNLVKYRLGAVRIWNVNMELFQRLHGSTVWPFNHSMVTAKVTSNPLTKGTHHDLQPE